MNQSSRKEPVGYRTIYVIQKLLMRVPLKGCLWLGRTAGTVLYLLPKKRRTAFRNVKTAFPEMPPRQAQGIVKRYYRDFGVSIVSLLIAPRVLDQVDLKGIEHTLAEGGILTSVHAGNWEIFGYVLARVRPYAVLAKRQKKTVLDRFLHTLRTRGGIRVCYTLKEVVACLKENYLVAVVMDHGAEKDAAYIDFFSHPVPTPGGAVYLARKFNKQIFPSFGYYEDGFRIKGNIASPVNPAGIPDRELLTSLNRFFEQQIRLHPHAYLWYYKRFKRKKDLQVVVLDDGKKGHYNQSKAFVSFLREEPVEIKVQTVNVRYRQSGMRQLADGCAMLFGAWGGEWCLRWCLASRTWHRLQHIYADVVVSAGNYAAPVNRLFASFIGARAVTILKPNVPVRKYDLAVIPEHDRVFDPAVVTIKGALTYPCDTEEPARQCRAHFALGPEKKIALCVGGPLRSSRQFMERLSHFLAQLKQYAPAHQLRLLVTTSRRTPPEAEEEIIRQLKDFRCTEALVLARRKNFPFVFPGFVALAEQAFISGESISMVSEAAAWGTPCAAVMLESFEGKHRLFLESIRDEVRVLEPPFHISAPSTSRCRLYEHNRNQLKKALKECART
ncbi:MAG: hypothetical protein GF333_04200 [Candidatus Omnitrophica bacterium]|nr:hypothetical protein [Candidatus Omnitrophota bacterium]